MNTESKSPTFTIDVARLSLLAEQIAAAFSTRENPGAVLVELVGDMGGGKTAFVKAMAKALGIEATITSPTFTIHQRYNIPDSDGYLEHFDLYRLDNDDIVLNEVQDALSNPHSIICIEWGQHFVALSDLGRLTIKFEYVDDAHRKVTLASHGSYYQKLLETIQ